MNHIKKKFTKEQNISVINVTDKITKKVEEFYKTNPFPNYKIEDNKHTILKKGNKNFLAREFKNFIGFKKNILEVGCGTGQLSIYFALQTNNNIVGLDATLNSLKLASNFSIKNNIENVNFVNADIFDDVFKDNFFDFIWCNGVLHHTKNPYDGFKILIKSLKKEGYILVGLYNRYGRIRTIIRQFIYKFFGLKPILFLDPTLRNLKKNENEKNAWIKDVKFGTLDYSSDELVEVELTLRFDWAIYKSYAP